ncbi:MAG: hypothetical protein KDI33_14125 [Halioglobus sp.]|nr:hypothetical protein [Halioglobus sp.]
MTFRRVFLLAFGLALFLTGLNARASYVVEAEGVATNTGAMTTGADFDFVAHDFGMEAKDAIQLSLDNLGSAINLQGNLLTWSPGEDYSYYDSDAVDDAGQGSTGSLAKITSGTGNSASAVSGEALPAGIHGFSPVDIDTIFWILGPTEFTSFSQLTAARFGFDHGK